MGFRKPCKQQKNGILLQIQRHTVTFKDYLKRFVILYAPLHILMATCQNAT